MASTMDLDNAAKWMDFCFSAFTHCVIHSLPILPLLSRCPQAYNYALPILQLESQCTGLCQTTYKSLTISPLNKYF